MVLPVIIGAAVGGYGVHSLNKHLQGTPGAKAAAPVAPNAAAGSGFSTSSKVLFTFAAVAVFVAAAKYKIL